MFYPINRYALHRRRRLLLLISVIILFLFITIKTQPTSTIIDRTIVIIRTSHYCQTRLNYLHQSWIPISLSQQSNIYILTDNLLNYTNKTLLNSFQNLIETDCPQTHKRIDLCCKTAHEFELFTNLSQNNSNLDWMCRFDDDQYVNLNNLYQFLSQIDSSKFFYIGRASTYERSKLSQKKYKYQFATYGAGVCFSRPLLEKLRPYVNKTIFPYHCHKLHLADDACIGYLTEFILNISLTSLNNLFHSHLEELNISFHSFSIEDLQHAITFGFAWDRYPLSWLPIIHQLIELINQGQKNAAKILWIFLQNYEKEHPKENKYDRSCSIYDKIYLNNGTYHG
jgi:fringe protein